MAHIKASEVWAAEEIKAIDEAAALALEFAGGDAILIRTIHRGRSLATELVNLIASGPTFAATPVEQWPIAHHRRLVDDVSQSERGFRELGEQSTPGAIAFVSLSGRMLGVIGIAMNSDIVATPTATPADGKRQPKISTNARMIDILTRCYDARSWTVSEWCEKLNVGRATVNGTDTWRTLMRSRAESRDSRYGPKQKRTKRD